jgi:hypothetical protein
MHWYRLQIEWDYKKKTGKHCSRFGSIYVRCDHALLSARLNALVGNKTKDFSSSHVTWKPLLCRQQTHPTSTTTAVTRKAAARSGVRAVQTVTFGGPSATWQTFLVLSNKSDKLYPTDAGTAIRLHTVEIQACRYVDYDSRNGMSGREWPWPNRGTKRPHYEQQMSRPRWELSASSAVWNATASPLCPTVILWTDLEGTYHSLFEVINPAFIRGGRAEA